MEKGFQEAWSLRLTHPEGRHALQLRFVLLRSHNGFRRHCEVWATFFDRATPASEVRKTFIKQSFNLSEFQSSSTPGRLDLQFGNVKLNGAGTAGAATSKGRTIRWNLSWPSSSSSLSWFQRVPASLRSSFKSVTLRNPLPVSGAVEIEGQSWRFEETQGLFEHWGGASLPPAWAHGFALFPGETILEASALQSRILGNLRTPFIHSFRIHYRGEDFRFEGLWESLRVRSQLLNHGWKFQLERGELRFVGEIQGELKSYAGLCNEDPHGNLGYLVSTGLARATLLVYRRGKLEGSFETPSAAQLEISRQKPDPYVELLS
jgi:hypothetical protein